MSQTARNAKTSDPVSLSADGTASLAEMYRALVEEIPAVLYINGPEENAHTLFVSPQTKEILGIAPDGWFDSSWTNHVHPDDIDAVDSRYVQALRNSVPSMIDEYRFVKPDGEEIWLHDRIRIIRDEHGNPAFVQGIMFDVTAQKRNEELLAKQTRQIQRIEEIGQRFTAVLLAGGTLQSILDALADIVGMPVVFDDSARQLVGFATVPGWDDARVLERWASHSRLDHHPKSRGECTWSLVRLRDEEWGRLHVLTGDDPSDEIDALAVDRAAAAIGLALLSGLDRAALADRARSELIADLWQGRRWTGADALARSESLGGDLTKPVLVGIAVEFSWSGRQERGGSRDPGGQHDPGADRLLHSVQSHLQRIAAEAGMSCLAAVVGSVCLAIVGLTEEDRARVLAGRLARDVQEAVREDLRGRIMSVGISRQGDADALRRILTEATDSAAHGAHTLQASGVYHSTDLGLRHLLARLGDGPELGRFVEDELGPLLAHDASAKSPLIPTLRAYLESGGQKATAARALHLERRSLYYRLERIESLLDADLDDPSARLRAQVALQGLDVLRQRHAGSGPHPL